MANHKRILIADDDEAILDATAMLLEAVGYEVSITLDGSTVMNELQSKPDLLLLDIWMSGVDGREVCKMVKNNKLTMDIPVLMISASRDIKQSALDAGADGFLEKPFDMYVLLDKIVSLIGE